MRKLYNSPQIEIQKLTLTNELLNRSDGEAPPADVIIPGVGDNLEGISLDDVESDH